MRKLFTPLFFLMLTFQLSALEVSVTHAAFKGAASNYIELNFYIVGISLTQVQVDSINSQGSLEVTTLFKQNGQVTKFDKIVLKSPKSLDPIDFFEMRRYELANGVYDIEVQFKDLKKESNVATFKSMFIMDFNDRNLRQSDISLLSRYKADSSDSKYTKNGIYMESLPYQYYDQTYKELAFYNEIYNTDKYGTDDFLLSYSIEKANAQANELSKAIGHKRYKPTPFMTNLATMDISNLETGNYRLVVSLHNRNNDLLSQKEVFFQRGNAAKEVNLDTISADALQKEFVSEMDNQQLKFSLKAIGMNLPDTETAAFKEMMNDTSREVKQRYLFKYWAKKNPTLPEQAHDEYMMVARAVDKTYNNGFGYGFETDRGRIFLRYGRPDDVVTVENEANAPPYEVWVYSKVARTEQTNVKFLFYNPKLVVNGYTLLHSTCRGEMSNPRWLHELYKNVPNELIGGSVDGREVKPGINRRASQIFNDN
jgi:GWxTD domain-containing protein